jgi:hypothetical protein
VCHQKVRRKKKGGARRSMWGEDGIGVRLIELNES